MNNNTYYVGDSMYVRSEDIQEQRRRLRWLYPNPYQYVDSAFAGLAYINTISPDARSYAEHFEMFLMPRPCK